MKIISIITIFLTIVYGASAQPIHPDIMSNRSRIDSLKKVLENSQPDTNRIRLLWHLSNSYTDYRTIDTAIKYIREAVELAEKIDAFSLSSTCLRKLGLLLEYKGQTTEALSNYLKALNISEQSKNKRQIGLNAKQIGLFFVVQKDYLQARKYLFLSKNLLEEIPGEWNLIHTFRGLGNVYNDNNQLDSAEFYFQQSRELSVKCNDATAELIALYFLGKLYAKKLDRRMAFKFLREGIDLASRMTTAGEYTAHLYHQMAVILNESGETDSSFLYAKQAYDFAEVFKNPSLRWQTAKLLSDHYVGKNEQEALRYLQIANKIKDSLYTIEQAQAVQNLSFQEQDRLQTIETEKREARNKYRLYSVLGILFTILAVAVVLYRSNRIKQRANAQLKEQKETIESTLSQLKTTQAQLIQSEKMASLGELTAGIAHEIQNPLNFVNNFSEVNSELLQELEQEALNGNFIGVQSLATIIKENEQKIVQHGRRADGIVKGMLQHSRNGAGQKELADINSLADEYLRLTYHGIRAKDKSFDVTLETNYDRTLKKILIVPQDIGRLFLNIINNAFHSVAEKQKSENGAYTPTVSVTTRILSQPYLVEIRIADNGLGIPEKHIGKIFQPFFTTKPTGHGTGLGLSLSYDIVKAHGGRITVNNRADGGAEFVIHLPYITQVQGEVHSTGAADRSLA